jgi:hypothetical protein
MAGLSRERRKMNVFLSFAHSDSDLAERLRRELEAAGISISTDRELMQRGDRWQAKIEAAIRSADAVLLLIHARPKPDAAQDFAWRATLEAVWENPDKRLIPILLRDAELPTFVRSSKSSGDIQAIRLRGPRDLRGAARAIVGALALGSDLAAPRDVGFPVCLRGEDLPGSPSLGSKDGGFPRSNRGDDKEGPPPSPGPEQQATGDPIDKPWERERSSDEIAELVESYSSRTEEDSRKRQERLNEIREFAEQLKP